MNDYQDNPKPHKFVSNGGLGEYIEEGCLIIDDDPVCKICDYPESDHGGSEIPADKQLEARVMELEEVLQRIYQVSKSDQVKGIVITALRAIPTPSNQRTNNGG